MFNIFVISVEYSKIVQQRQLLDGQLNENKSVLEELNRLNEDKNTVSHRIHLWFFWVI